MAGQFPFASTTGYTRYGLYFGPEEMQKYNFLKIGKKMLHEEILQLIQFIQMLMEICLIHMMVKKI